MDPEASPSHRSQITTETLIEHLQLLGILKRMVNINHPELFRGTNALMEDLERDLAARDDYIMPEESQEEIAGVKAIVFD